MSRTGRRLAELTWIEAAGLIGAGMPVLLPVGAAAKAHGPHLPLGTDRLVVEAVATRLMALLPVLVAPTVGHGFYPAFAGYPGSQHLKAETFQAVVTETADSFLRHGCRRIVILNNGVSTEAPLRQAEAAILQTHGIRILTFDLPRLGRSCDPLWAVPQGGHADERETSQVLALMPAQVRLDRLGETVTTEAADGRLSANGSSGDARAATAHKGEKLLAAVVDEIAATLRRQWPDLQAG